ncbi:anthranilate synthase family protein [Myceligenerans crystallogenes]|uniref:anthranilate synthase n=1 Tax=Myceligenerans crystallogenes TaxID=316335 RepID=A0ABP4ZIG0_9MICO
MTDLLAQVLGAAPGPFALLHRPVTGGRHVVDVITGEVSFPGTLSGVVLPGASGDAGDGGTRPAGAAPSAGPARRAHDVLVLLPYRQLAERGFDAPDDGTPLVALTVRAEARVPLGEILDRIPDVPVALSGSRFAPDDAGYADRVRRVVEDEIATGQGANFVLRRTFSADLTTDLTAEGSGDTGRTAALTLFRRLLEHEQGAHWTFVVFTGDRYLVGASPERHVSLEGGVAVMNPISGTFRYPPGGADLPSVMGFLADRKESGELAMVLDEELKMMARICPDGGRVSGPHLKEMAALAHTEYFISGRTTRDPREILRETLFAPTVTGSPLESACRVIARYEPEGRGYYSGVAALIGRDDDGAPAMDSAILIRTADIDARGHLDLAVGATIVRDSDPDGEAAETRAKAEGLLTALRGRPRRGFALHPEVRGALEGRNEHLSGFWLDAATTRDPMPELAGRSILLVDAEDTFTAMMVQQLRTTGADVTVRRFDEPYDDAGHDLVLLGPGPGDPNDPGSPKMRHLRGEVRRFLASGRPFLAVCLSHQVLSRELGLPVRRRERPNQGVQHTIDLFGSTERVGFYNSFAAVAPSDVLDVAGIGRVDVCRDTATGEVHALHGPGFASVQFHAESVLTIDGDRIIAQLAGRVARTLEPTSPAPVP